MENWKTETLENCLSALIDYRGKTPNKTSFGVPLITAKIVKNGRIEKPNEFIAEKDYDSWMTRGFPKIGDVILTTEAPLGEVAQINDERIALAQRIILLRGKENYLDNSYLKYFLISDFGQSQLSSRQSGTTVFGIKQSELRKIKIIFPSFEEQKAIAKILLSLDDKIEINRQMNATLETMARVLFKAWFVDFEPVRANMKNRSSDSASPEIAKLFPSEFENDIPKDWRLSSIGEEVEVVGGGTPSTKEPSYWNGEYNWVTPKDFSNLADKVLIGSERTITEAGLAKISSGKLPVETVLLSSRAPVGYLAIAKIPVAINQGFIAMKCSKSLPSTYILQWTEQSMDKIKSRASGTTFAEINKANFRPLSVIVPSKPVVEKYDGICKLLYDQITTNAKENQTLSQIRDELLPKLIQGKIRVSTFQNKYV